MAKSKRCRASLHAPDDYLNETPSAVIWKFKDRNCLGVMEYSSAPEMEIRGRYYAADEFFEIQGSKGAIWVTRCTGEMLDLPPVMVVKGTETTGIQVPMDWIEGFNGAARQFIDCIINDEQPDMDIISHATPCRWLCPSIKPPTKSAPSGLPASLNIGLKTC